MSSDLVPESAAAAAGPSVARRVKGLTRDSLVYGLGVAGQKVIGLILLPILTRVFEPAEYGATELIGLVLLFASYFAVVGNDAALLRFFFDTDSEREQRAIASVALLFRASAAIVLTTILWPWSEDVSRLIFSTPIYSGYIRVTLLTLVFTTIVKFCVDLLRVRLRPMRFVAYSLGNLAAIALLTLILTPDVLTLEIPVINRAMTFRGQGQGLRGVFYARLFADALFAGLGLIWCWRDLARPAGWPVLRGMLRFGAPLLPVGLAQFVLSYADRYTLNRFVSLDQVGPYSVGAKVASFMMLFVAAFQYAWGPFAISIFRESNARETYAKVFSLYVFVAGAIGLVLTGLAREFLTLITTSHYVHGYRMAGFLVFAAVANGAFTIPAASLQIAKRTGWMGGIAILAAVLNVVLNLILVRPLEAYGVATASLLAQCASVVCLMVVAQRIYPVPFHLGRTALNFLLAMGLAALGIYFGRGGAGAAILSTLVALVLYLAGAFLLRTIGIQDWLILRNYARRKQAEYAGRPDPHELK
jgi:O-antigen/teichoic acid export membrane protein